MLPHNSAESPRIRPGLPPLFVAQRLGRQQARRLAWRVEAEEDADLRRKAGCQLDGPRGDLGAPSDELIDRKKGDRSAMPRVPPTIDDAMGSRSAARPAILQLLHALAQRLQFSTQLLDFGTPLR